MIFDNPTKEDRNKMKERNKRRVAGIGYADLGIF